MLGTWYTVTTPLSWRHYRVVKMLRSKGQQGQVSPRQALTVATTGTYGYMQRCHAKMRSGLPNITVRFTARILSLAFISLDLCVEGDRNTQYVIYVSFLSQITIYIHNSYTQTENVQYCLVNPTLPNVRPCEHLKSCRYLPSHM